MKTLEQICDGILAKPKALDSLANKETAQLLCISDSHGDKTIVSDIIRKFGPETDALIFTGDGITDLMSFIEKSCHFKEINKALPPVIAYVRGNNDYSLIQTDFSKSLFVPKKLIIKVANRTILLTHGNEEHVYYSTDILETIAQMENCQAAIYGHTHVPADINHMVYCMNPGSVSLPRAQSPRSFAILEVGSNYFSPVFYKIDTSITTTFTPYFPQNYSF